MSGLICKQVGCWSLVGRRRSCSGCESIAVWCEKGVLALEHCNLFVRLSKDCFCGTQNLKMLAGVGDIVVNAGDRGDDDSKIIMVIQGCNKVFSIWTRLLEWIQRQGKTCCWPSAELDLGMLLLWWNPYIPFTVKPSVNPPPSDLDHSKTSFAVENLGLPVDDQQSGCQAYTGDRWCLGWWFFCRVKLVKHIKIFFHIRLFF